MGFVAVLLGVGRFVLWEGEKYRSVDAIDREANTEVGYLLAQWAEPIGGLGWRRGDGRLTW